MQPETDWAAVVDGRHVRIFARAAPAGPWRECAEEAVEVGIVRSGEIGTDRPGRTHESVGPMRHAIAPRTDPHDAAEALFLREVAHRLDEAARDGLFGRLYLVAPPAALGQLRAAMGPLAVAMVAGSLPRDLVRLPPPRIAERLAATW